MERLLSWFFLKSVPGIGNHLFKRLIERFASPERVLDAPAAELVAVKGMTRRIVASLRAHRLPEAVKKDLDRVREKGCRVVTQTDDGYPRLLREIPDPPPFLYVLGRLDAGIRNVAVVGSRNPSHYGTAAAAELSASLAAMAFTVVSGMARGIDTAAHEGALTTGRTVAVLGSGLDRVYPAENRKLFHRIAERGAVISEFPLSTEPEGRHFPVRNRVISGMCLGTLVVEAALRSGSLITAKLAAEQNREVFAVPGSIQSFKSRGTHALIREGAKLVEHAGDVVDELLPQLPPSSRPSAAPREKGPPRQQPLLAPEELSVYRELGPYPVHIDELGRRLGMAPGKLSGILLAFELRGIVHQSPGNRFSLQA